LFRREVGGVLAELRSRTQPGTARALSACGAGTARRTGPSEQCGGDRAVQPRVCCLVLGAERKMHSGAQVRLRG